MAGRVGNMISAVGGVVDGSVNDALIDAVPKDSSRAIDQGLDEQDSVDLVNVVLMNDGVVEAAESRGDFLGQILTLVIEKICKVQTESGCGEGNPHQQVLGAAFRRLSFEVA